MKIMYEYLAGGLNTENFRTAPGELSDVGTAPERARSFCAMYLLPALCWTPGK